MEQRTQVAVSPNPIKETEHLDIDGNIINPFTKQIVKPVETIHYPTPPEQKVAIQQPDTKEWTPEECLRVMWRVENPTQEDIDFYKENEKSYSALLRRFPLK